VRSPVAATPKRVRIYELYRGPGGSFGNNSQNYALHGRFIVHVAARSIREAYYHANKGRWRDAVTTVGIVEQFDGNCWRHEDGTASPDARYRHGGSARKS
jgi:hypothetical protein